VVLCIDGFGSIRKDFEEIEGIITDLLQRGGGYGIHVVAGMRRWNDVRIAMQSNFGQKIELHLNDPSESTIARKLAETIKEGSPGRALTLGKLFAQTALPRFDGQPSDDELGTAVEDTVRPIDPAWTGKRAPAVRLLPPTLPTGSLPTQETEPPRAPATGRARPRGHPRCAYCHTRSRSAPCPPRRPSPGPYRSVWTSAHWPR